MKFSIITVCLNPGEKLNRTLNSVLEQTCGDWEVILKDGGSRDGSVAAWQEKVAAKEGSAAGVRCASDAQGIASEQRDADAQGIVGENGLDRIRIFVEQDKGIYDAMNQAVAHAAGEFVLFLNCGDVFPAKDVLERTLQAIKAEEQLGTDLGRLVLYGDTYSEKNDVVIASAPEITGFTCYRNIPCHQSCFYATGLCVEKPYDLQYRIRADYDHFLWCYYQGRAVIKHMDFAVASYEGGGYSESKENRARDKQEHGQITATYMSRSELFRYKAMMAATLAPLRRAMAESKVFSGMYHGLKELLYAARRK